MAVTVEELLADDTFNTQYDARQMRYNECLQYYMMGQFKDCLETLVQYDLWSSKEGRQLFNSACDGVNKFETLGVSMHPILDDYFSEDQWDQHNNNNTEEEEPLSHLNKYLRNCFKWIQWRGKQDNGMVVEGFKQYVESVMDLSRLVNSSVDDVFELVKFYLLQLEVELRHRHKSIDLYDQLCRRYPDISHILKTSSVLGTTYEDNILKSLQRDKKPIQKVKPEPVSDIPAPVEDLVEDEEETQTNLHITHHYKQLIERYVTGLSQSRYKHWIPLALVIASFLLYKCGRWLQRRSPRPIHRVIQWLLQSMDHY